MPEKGGLQFLPAEHRRFSVRFEDISGWFLVSVFFLLALAGVYFYIIRQTNSVKTEIAEIDSKLMVIQRSRDDATETHLLEVSRQLTSSRNLMKDHIYWSSAIRAIQATIQPRVKLTSMSLETDGKRFSFRAAGDSYTTVAKQIAALYASDIVKDLSLTTVQQTTDGTVEFTVNILLEHI